MQSLLVRGVLVRCLSVIQGSNGAGSGKIVVKYQLLYLYSSYSRIQVRLNQRYSNMLIRNWCRRYISMRTVSLQGRIVRSLSVQGSSMVLAQVGSYAYRREAYRFRQQYNASGRLRYPQANWHGAYQFMRWQYGASDGLYSLDNLGIGYGYLWQQQYNTSDRFRRLKII